MSEHRHYWEVLLRGTGEDRSGFVQCMFKGCDDVRYLDAGELERFVELRRESGGDEIELAPLGGEATPEDASFFDRHDTVDA